MPGVGFLATVCLRLSHTFWCGVFLVHPVHRNHLASFWISFRGNCFLGSCGFHAPVGGREFRSLLGYHLRPEFLKLVFSYILKGVKKWLCLATCNNSDCNGLNKQEVDFSHLLGSKNIGISELMYLLHCVVIILGYFYLSVPLSLVYGFHLYECTTKHSIHILGKKGRVEFKRGMNFPEKN